MTRTRSVVVMVVALLAACAPKGDLDLVALGAVLQPPIHQNLDARGLGTPGDSAFARAMELYALRDYAKASQHFRAALAAGADSVTSLFFLGASALTLNNNVEAAEAFGRVTAVTTSAYTPEARYYRAKALIRLGRVDDARTELKLLTTADGASYKIGTALADSLGR